MRLSPFVEGPRPWRVREPPGSEQRSAPARPRPSPPPSGEVGDGSRVHPRPKALLSSNHRAEPRGGPRGPPPNRTSRSIYVVRGRNLGPKIPFSSRRDGPRLVSRYDTPIPRARRIPELTGEGQTRRPACAAARWADASLARHRPVGVGLGRS